MNLSILKLSSAPQLLPIAGAGNSVQVLGRWLRLLAPRASTPAQDAAELRALASRLPAAETGFANDLYAAADRHELGV